MKKMDYDFWMTMGVITLIAVGMGSLCSCTIGGPCPKNPVYYDRDALRNCRASLNECLNDDEDELEFRDHLDLAKGDKKQ